MKGLAQPFESLHQVQIIPRGSCFYFLWVFACIFPLDSSKYLAEVYDVKTCGARIFNGSKRSSCGYGVLCPKKTPVQFMEDEVPGLWQAKIRNVDKKWNQTKSGDLGPAAQFYATIPRGVIGLGAGATSLLTTTL